MDERIFCTHCGQDTAHTQRGTAIEHEDLDVGDGQIYPAEWTVLFMQCNGCGSTSIYVTGEANDSLTRVYPAQQRMVGVPDGIKKSYEAAKKIIHVSPEGFCLMVRSALEHVCNDKNAQGRDLKSKIDYLNQQGIIPETLGQMSHKIRTLGNNVAHAGGFMPTWQDARVMDEFFIALVEYVYIAPEKLRILDQRINGQSA